MLNTNPSFDMCSVRWFNLIRVLYENRRRGGKEQRQHNIIAEVFMTCKNQLLWELLQCIYKSVYKCYFLSQPKQISEKYRPKS